MPPQTRSTIKPSPGRSTRNSVYGRPPPSPPKPRKSTTNTEVKDKATPDDSATNGTPWLSCRDAYGVLTTVALSETGEGVHIRWYYPDDDCELDEQEEADVVGMIVDEERSITPPTTTAGPSHFVRRLFPATPLALHPYDAGSVIRTPIKKAKPLQPSPPRIGDKGIRCLYEKGGVLRELNGGVRVILRHPIGSSANLSREQVERLQQEREERIIEIQVKKLLERDKRLLEEEEGFSDSGYEDEMETDVASPQRGLQREDTNGTIIIVSHNDYSNDVPPASQEETGFRRGPNGELLDHRGYQMLGREGTFLMDPTIGSPRRIRREEAFQLLPTEIWESINQSSLSDASDLGFNQEATEMIG